MLKAVGIETLSFKSCWWQFYFHIAEMMPSELNGVNVGESRGLFGCRETLETSASH